MLVTGRTGLGGTGSAAQGVVGTSCKAHGEPSSSENRAHRPGGDGESCPGGVPSLLPGPMGGHLLQRTGRTCPGGTGSPAQGVLGVSCQANGGPSSSEDRAHRPWGMGSPTQGAVGASFRAYGGPSSPENRAHRPGGDGESRPGGGLGLLQCPWGGVIC